MNLEDHFGDVLRKGRTAADLTVQQLSVRAGLGEPEIDQIEESGKVSRAINFQELGKALGMDPKKLERSAGGWKPKPVDLSVWQQLRMFTSEGDGITVNCFLVWEEISREAALFDTGFDVELIFKTLEKEQVQLKHLFITHSHPDHIAGMEKIRERFPKLHLHSNSKNAPPQHRNRANDFIHMNSLRITNRETPGHAEDGVTYIVGNWPEDAPHVAIVGDAIFAGSMGRGNQSWDLAKQKVRENIFSLPSDTLICPGHGPLTTVQEEKENNPFF